MASFLEYGGGWVRRVGWTSVLTNEAWTEHRTDERSMSRDELAQSMPCKEEEGEAKPRRSPRFLHFYRDMCPKVRIYSSFGICFLGKFVYLPTESPEKRCMMRRILSVGIGIVWFCDDYCRRWWNDMNYAVDRARRKKTKSKRRKNSKDNPKT